MVDFLVTSLAFLMFLASLALGGILDRGVRGGANTENSLGTFFTKFPKGVRLLVSAAAMIAFLPFFYSNVLTSALSTMILVSTLSVSMMTTSEGHGEQMDLALSPEETEGRNHADMIFGKEGFWAEFWGLSFTGFLITLPVGVAMAISPIFVPSANYALAVSFGVLYSVIGWSKGWCYLVAQQTELKIPALWVPGPDYLGRNPDGGEFLWGTVKYGTLGLLTFLYVLLS